YPGESRGASETPREDRSMAPTVRAPSPPSHPLAIAALLTAVLAGALALYGSFLSQKHLAGSPLNVARDDPGLAVTRDSKLARYALQVVAYVLPFVLGVGAALMGGEAMKAVERSNGAKGGNRHAVFAIMIGGLAAVVAGCMILAVYVWKYLPTLYTT